MTPQRGSQLYLKKAYEKQNSNAPSSRLLVRPQPKPAVKKSLASIAEKSTPPPPIPAVLQHALQSRGSSAHTTAASSKRNDDHDIMHQEQPWFMFRSLGQLRQRDVTLTVCHSKTTPDQLIMFKETNNEQGRLEQKRLQACRHDYVIRLRETFEYGQTVMLGMDYCPTTLEEVLQTHLPLSVSHLQIIANTVELRAILYMARIPKFVNRCIQLLLMLQIMGSPITRLTLVPYASRQKRGGLYSVSTSCEQRSLLTFRRLLCM